MIKDVFLKSVQDGDIVKLDTESLALPYCTLPQGMRFSFLQVWGMVELFTFNATNFQSDQFTITKAQFEANFAKVNDDEVFQSPAFAGFEVENIERDSFGVEAELLYLGEYLGDIYVSPNTSTIVACSETNLLLQHYRNVAISTKHERYTQDTSYQATIYKDEMIEFLLRNGKGLVSLEEFIQIKIQQAEYNTKPQKLLLS